VKRLHATVEEVEIANRDLRFAADLANSHCRTVIPDLNFWQFRLNRHNL
jgi:hypothetical protein